MKSVLFLAAGPLQLPAIEEAKRMGIRTVAVDADPSAVGLRASDISYIANILDVDAVLAIAKAERVEGILTLCTDAPVRTVAAVADTLGLPALSRAAARCATDKREMRRALKAGCAHPVRSITAQGLYLARAAAKEIGFPVVLKTPCSSGSRGIRCATSELDLASAFDEACFYQEDGSVLIEEWLDGPEVSVEGICFKEVPTVVQITDKLLFCGKWLVEAGHIQPARQSAENLNLISEAAIEAVRSLGLNNCAFHAEIKLTQYGPRVIEIGARLGGDRITTDLVPLSTGVNLVRAVIDVALDRRPVIDSHWNRGAAIRYFQAPRLGVLADVEGLHQIREQPGCEFLFASSERDGALRPGFQIRAIRSSLDRYGYVIFSGADAQQAASRAEHALQLIRFNYQSFYEASYPKEQPSSLDQ